MRFLINRTARNIITRHMRCRHTIILIWCRWYRLISSHSYPQTDTIVTCVGNHREISLRLKSCALSFPLAAGRNLKLRAGVQRDRSFKEISEVFVKRATLFQGARVLFLWRRIASRCRLVELRSSSERRWIIPCFGITTENDTIFISHIILSHVILWNANRNSRGSAIFQQEASSSTSCSVLHLLTLHSKSSSIF